MGSYEADGYVALVLLGLLSLFLPVVESSCCMPGPPPEFRLGAPPMPPGLKAKAPYCEALKDDDRPYYTVHQYNQSTHHSSGVATTHDDFAPSTPPSHPSTDKKKAAPVGMILGIIIGLLLLLVVALVAWMFTKKKNLKYQIEPESDQEKQGNFLYNYRIRGWFWRKSDTKPRQPSKGRTTQHGAKRGERSMSTTSSESGYCEEPAIESHAERGTEAPPVLRRLPKEAPDSLPLASGTEATPDIIASTQLADVETPKRWSLFGLLPSLKPVLASRGLDADVPQLDSPQLTPDSPEMPMMSRFRRNRSQETPPEGTSQGISMKLLGTPSWMNDKKLDSSKDGRDVAEAGDDALSGGEQPVSQKRSRIRIKLNKKKQDPEVNV